MNGKTIKDAKKICQKYEGHLLTNEHSRSKDLRKIIFFTFSKMDFVPDAAEFSLWFYEDTNVNYCLRLVKLERTF